MMLCEMIGPEFRRFCRLDELYAIGKCFPRRLWPLIEVVEDAELDAHGIDLFDFLQVVRMHTYLRDTPQFDTRC